MHDRLGLLSSFGNSGPSSRNWVPSLLPIESAADLNSAGPGYLPTRYQESSLLFFYLKLLLLLFVVSMYISLKNEPYYWIFFWHLDYLEKLGKTRLIDKRYL